MIASLFAMVGLTTGGQDTHRPPTIDPTYGFSVPKIDTTVAKRLKPTADWIWASKTLDNQVIFVRGAVNLSRAGAKAYLYVTADNYFTAYVNGQKVGERDHAAGVDNWQSVQKYDVTSLLVSGKNVVAIRGENAGGKAGVLARLEVGGKPVLESSKAWKEADQNPGDWTQPGFDDSGWSAVVSEGPADSSPWLGGLSGWPGLDHGQPAYLKHLAMYPVSAKASGLISVVTGKGHPAVIAVNGPGDVVIDFGQELTGRVELLSTTGLNVPVTVGTGESYDEAVNKPWTSAKLDLEQGKASDSPYTSYRFARLQFDQGAKGAVVQVNCDHLYYPVAYKGSFNCSEPLLTKVWYTGAYTAHLCMQEDIWDAPKRDRLKWMGDLHVSGEVINNAFADKFLMEQTMARLRADAQGGRPESELPSGHVNGIPGYSCAWIAGLADFHRHLGDYEYLKSQSPALVTMLDYMRTEMNQDGVFANKNKAWPFVDWAPEFDGDHPLARVATTLFYAYAVSEAAFIFHELGDTAHAIKCEAWRSQLEEAAQKNLVDSSGIFGDRRQANAMAVYSGVATPQQREKIQRDILAPNAPAWNWVATPYYNNYVLFAMKDSTEALQVIRRIWGQMILEGATTFYEGYDPSWEKEHFHQHLQADDGTGYFVSLCHGWSAGPTDYLTERVLGVSPKSGGFKTFVIEPDLGDLKWAEGTIPTPKSSVKVRLDRKGSDLALKITVPAGSIGKLVLKGTPSASKGHLVSDGDHAWTLLPGEYSILSKSEF